MIQTPSNIKRLFRLKAILASCVLVLLCSCSTSKDKNVDLIAEKNLGRLSKLGSHSVSNDKSVSPLRAEMIREAALSVGARTGLAHRANQINILVGKYDHGLSRVFNFAGLMLDDNVVPPILIESDSNLNLADSRTIRVSDRTFEIIEQARFVTASPTWREYLITNLPVPEDPAPGLLPKTPGERIIWRKYVEVGFKAGIKQAESIFNENVARLSRDFKGMIRYHGLLANNMVTPPYVAGIDMGVTGDKSKVNIRDRVLRITALPEINTDSKQWKTVVNRYER